MHKKYCLVLLTTFVLLLFNIIPFITYAQEADNRLFRSPALGFANTLSGEKMLAEQMIVYVDFNVLKGEEGHAPNLLLEIFGQSIQVDQTRVDERGPTDYAWCGKAKDGSISNAVLTVGDKIMFGRIEYLDSVYVVEPVEEGPLHRITKIDPTKAMPFGNDALIPPQNLKPEVIAPQSSLQEPLSAALDDGSVIDIMVLYTDGMASAYPGTQIDTKIQSLVDFANNAYTNSNVNTSLNVVKTQQVSYTDGGSLNTALYELSDGTGVFSNVATWRDTYSADVVTLLRRYQDTNDSCGLGWIMTTDFINSSFSFAPWAFNVVQEGSRTDGYYCDGYTLAHEVGHNMGCGHDRDNSSSPGAYDYSYGYDVAGIFATIMSYDDPNVGYFSNPNVLYSGLPMGVPEGQPDSADNAKTINNTKSIVANFRAMATILISHTSHDFGSVNVGSTSPPHTFTATNMGDADLIIGALGITGAGASEFIIQNDNCSAQTIAASGTCIVDVVFSPSFEGTKSANLSIPSNDLDTPTLDVPLSGIGRTCTYSISPADKSFSSDGGTDSVSVTTYDGCDWTAASNVSWITLDSGTSGTGSGTVIYTVSANTSISSREGTITIVEQTFTVTQIGIDCIYSISPASQSFDSDGGNDFVSVTTYDGCDWTAASNVSWMTLDSGTSGTGSGTVIYTVSANTSISSREGTITIVEQTFMVIQTGIDCTYSISPTSNSFGSNSGTGSVGVTSESGCTWTATSNDLWITIGFGSSEDGDGTVNYSVSENTSTSSRTGTITIAGETFAVSQSASIPVTRDPIPGIKANDSEETLDINEGGQLSIAISLDPGSYSGTSADWYIVVNTPSGWQSFNISQMDYSTSGISILLQDYGLFSIDYTEIFSTSSLSAGTYTYYFGVDLNMNGTLDIGTGQFYYDSVEVAVAVGEISAPTGFNASASGSTVTLSWNAGSGVDGYKLYYGYSSGNYAGSLDLGNIANKVISNVPDGTYYLSIKAYVDSNESSYSDEASITIGEQNASPTATITSPSTGSTYTQGNSIAFGGIGNDTEDGSLNGNSLVWKSNVDGQIGTGTSFTHSALSVGTHTITLTATDSEGATGSDSVSTIVESVESIIDGELSVSFTPNPVLLYTGPDPYQDTYPEWHFTIYVEEINGVGVAISEFTWDYYDSNENWISQIVSDEDDFVDLFDDCGLGNTYIGPYSKSCGNFSSTLGSSSSSGSIILTFYGIDDYGNQISAFDRIWLNELSSLPNTSPTATITSPSTGSTYTDGGSITFSGTGNDTEDGTLSGSALVWKSNVDGQIGTDTSFTYSGLSVGTHTITLTATDSEGATGSGSVSITVESIVSSNYNLPDTGQTVSYTDIFGEDSDYTINPPSYTDNADGTVTDNATGLIWQQEDDNKTYNWYEASGTEDDTYNQGGTVGVCSSLTLAGYSDWRLPTVMELKDIVNCGTDSPAIDTIYFPNTGFAYWSSTTVLAYDVSAFAVDFYSSWSGRVNGHLKSVSFSVRCVRGEDYPTQSFIDNGDGTVTDNNTELMWQQENDGIEGTWEEAITYCENISLAGYSNWRLPNKKELNSIVNYDKFYPAIDETYFPNTYISSRYSYYWSSTTAVVEYVSDTSYAWKVVFSGGSVTESSKSDSENVNVMCVRGGE